MRNDQVYLDFDSYVDQDTEVRGRKVKLVTTRKPQVCFDPYGDTHTIEPGARARYETAIVDGEFGRYYTCLKCIDNYLDEHAVEAS